MATLLKKVVVRECDRPTSSGRKLIVMLEPGDILAMKEKFGRTVFRGSLERIYMVLAKWHVDRENEQKQKDKKLRKMGLA